MKNLLKLFMGVLIISAIPMFASKPVSAMPANQRDSVICVSSKLERKFEWNKHRYYIDISCDEFHECKFCEALRTAALDMKYATVIQGRDGRTYIIAKKGYERAAELEYSHIILRMSWQWDVEE